MTHDWAFDFNLTRRPDGTYTYDGPALEPNPALWAAPAVFTAAALTMTGFILGVMAGYALALSHRD